MFEPAAGNVKIITLTDALLDTEGRVHGKSDPSVGFVKRKMVVSEIIYTSPSIVASSLLDKLVNISSKPIEVVVWVEAKLVGERWLYLYPVKTKESTACLRWRSIFGDGGLELDSYIPKEHMDSLKLSIERKLELDKGWSELSRDFLKKINGPGQ